MDEYQILSEILKMSLSLDKIAHKTYYKFYKNTTDPKIKAKWLKRSKEEAVHITFWEKALSLSQKKQLPLVFKDTGAIRDKIKRIYSSINTALKDFEGEKTYPEQLILAFMLESYMLSPTFMIMFHEYRFIVEGIEKQYKEHILAFVKMIRRLKGKMTALHINVFSENLYDLYCLTEEYLNNALHDTLTNLYNRRGFIEQAKPLLSLAERKRFDAGIIMLDFDNFKNINDHHGHEAGDAALKAEASIIKSCIRESDIAGRYGGDEFIIFTAVDDLDALKNICERIRETTEKKSQELAGFSFTVSLGAAKGGILRPYEKYLAQIINHADQKLYEAKSKGKNNWAL